VVRGTLILLSCARATRTLSGTLFKRTLERLAAYHLNTGSNTGLVSESKAAPAWRESVIEKLMKDPLEKDPLEKDPLEKDPLEKDQQEKGQQEKGQQEKDQQEKDQQEKG